MSITWKLNVRSPGNGGLISVALKDLPTIYLLILLCDCICHSISHQIKRIAIYHRYKHTMINLPLPPLVSVESLCLQVGFFLSSIVLEDSSYFNIGCGVEVASGRYISNGHHRGNHGLKSALGFLPLGVGVGFPLGVGVALRGQVVGALTSRTSRLSFVFNPVYAGAFQLTRGYWAFVFSASAIGKHFPQTFILSSTSNGIAT